MAKKAQVIYDLFGQPISATAQEHFLVVMHIMRNASEAHKNNNHESLPEILTYFRKSLIQISKKSDFDPTRTYPEKRRGQDQIHEYHITPLWYAHKLMDKSPEMSGFRDTFAKFYPKEVDIAEYCSNAVDATEETHKKPIISQEEMDKLYEDRDHTDMYRPHPRNF